MLVEHTFVSMAWMLNAGDNFLEKMKFGWIVRLSCFREVA